MKHPDFKHVFLLASGLFTGPRFVDGLGWGWGWVGVGMFTFVGTCKRHGCYADDGVGLGLGWGCLRSLELADAMDVTLMMGWVWGWGGDVHIRWNLHTPWMLR